MASGKQKSRLGRGLSSLISISDPANDAEPIGDVPASAPEPTFAAPAAAPDFANSQDVRQPPAPSGSPLEIPLDQIVANPHQPRKDFDPASIAELAASIKTTGIIQPIIVKPVPNGYQLIAGERRLRAAQIANLATIPAIVRDVDGFTQAQMALVENIQRQDLNAIERALAYQSLINQLGLTQAELAGRLGEERSSIANFLRLLDLTDAVQTMIRDGQLTTGHGKLLAGISDAAAQIRFATLTVDQNLSVRNLERLLQSPPPDASDKPKPAAPSAHVADLERSLSRQIGMRVQLRTAAKGKGRLTIHYGSLDQFDQLLGRLGVKTEI
jgi:ParB family chromosome partitioning protein